MAAVQLWRTGSGRGWAIVLAPVVVGAAAAAVTLAQPVDRQPPWPARGPWVPRWTVLYGGYRQVSDLAAVSPEEAWGVERVDVGIGGWSRLQTVFVHRLGDRWWVAQVVHDVGLVSLAVAGDFGLAVGDEGATYRFDGLEWRPLPSPVEQDLNDVALVEPDEGWAVGDRGTILYWDGQAWAVAESPLEFVRLTAVAAVGPGEAWAVSINGDVLHAQDGAWALAEAPRLHRLVDVAFASPQHGLAVGQGVLEWRDGRWQELATNFESVGAVAWDGDTAYVVAEGRLFAYQDGTWGPVSFAPAGVDYEGLRFRRVVADVEGVWGLEPGGETVHITSGLARHAWPRAATLTALDVLSPTFAWGGGLSLGDGFVGTLDGRSAAVQSLPAGTQVWNLDLVSATDGWAVGHRAGDLETSLLWRWDGARWSEWLVDKLWRPLGIEMLGPDEGWLVGQAVVRWNGQGWVQVTEAPAAELSGALSMLHGGASPEGWFGSYGQVYHLKDNQWLVEELPAPALVRVIDAVAADDVWAAGATDLFHYDGQSWRQVPVPVGPEATIQDLHAPEPGNMWLLVDPDGLFHWTGAGWEHHSLTPMGAHARPVRLRVIRPDPRQPDTEVWLAGEPPVLARYQVVVPLGYAYLPLLRNGSSPQ